MPIFEPDLVRRSDLSMTETATLATPGAVGAHGLGEIGEALHAQPLQHMLVIVERMARQEEADGVVLAPQPLGRSPGLDRRDAEGLLHHAAAEQLRLAAGSRLARAVRQGQHAVDRRHGAGAVRLQRIERAGRDQRLDGAAVDQLGVDPAGEIGKVRERAAGAARGHDGFDRRAADALDRAQRIADRAVRRRRTRRRSG